MNQEKTKVDFWKEIECLDLSSVKRKFLSRKSWFWRMRHDSDKIESEYRQFLYLIAQNPNKAVVPWSESLDEFWHEHILDTRKYEADCQKIFGTLIHHNPHLEVGTIAQAQAFSETKQMYKSAFKDKAKEVQSGHSSNESVGCGTIMPVVFCATSPAVTSESHHSSSSDHSASCGSTSSGASCGSSCGGSSCGSSCGGGGCGGGGD